MKTQEQPKTPCCNAPFIAIRKTPIKIDGIECKKCGKKYDKNLKPI